MGTFKVPIEVGNAERSRWERVEALVDTGSSITSIPRSLWESLGLTAEFRESFMLADGRQAEYDVASAPIRIEGRERSTFVLAAEDESAPLLGAYTLEGFFLAPDPVNQKLIRVPGWRA